MKKTTFFLVFTLFMFLFVTGCNGEDPRDSEQASSNGEPSNGDYLTYEDEYLRFEHPRDWETSGSASGNTNMVTIQQDSDYDFVLEAERISDLDSREDFQQRITEEFSQGLQAAEEEEYITKVSYGDITIDGYEGKSLELEVELLQGTGELLYQDLSEELNHHDEIQDLLSDYPQEESFIEAISRDEELQQELLEILTDLESQGTEADRELSFARARLEHIKAFLSEETHSEQRQKISIIAKENLVFRVYFFKEPEGYEAMIDQVMNVMDTIEFVD